METLSKLLEAIQYIDPDDYNLWTMVGMALKHEGYSVTDWDNWSRGSTKYKEGVCDRKWRSFNEGNAGDPVTGGTIIQMAKDAGWKPTLSAEAFDWDDEVEEIGRDYKIVDKNYVREKNLPQIQKNYDGAAELREYLNLLFSPDEHVGYCDKLTKNEKGEWEPKEGLRSRTAGQLIEVLRKGFENASIREESEGGAMIRFNPLDGEGENDSNVTAFRYTLVESDKESKEKQYALYEQMNLPIVVLVDSGNKSLHAIVHVDAETPRQYRERVNFIYDFCRKNGLTIDENNKNASRYSRMPGIVRNGNLQRIIATHIGAKDYEEWRQWADEQNDNLPKDVSLSEVLEDLPPLKEELIPGILRVGHKMLVSGPSKAAKSFLLCELAIAFAEGTEWLGHKCKQGKVLYVNLELDSASCFHRFADIYEKLKIPPAHTDNLRIWNLRGRSVPMNKLTPFIINRFKQKGYIAIIIDPIYKVITGDENSATEMSEFCSFFDRVAIEVETAMIYCHHHSKGAGSKYAKASDRASGSGVFARDPDAIIDLEELKVEDHAADKYRELHPDACETLSGWEMAGTLREFPPMKAQRMWFDYPVHRLDVENYLAEAKYSDKGSAGVGKNQQTREDAKSELDALFDEMTMESNEALTFDVINDEFGWGESKIKKFTTKTHNNAYEAGTLDDGTKVLFPRLNTEMIFCRGKCYQRPKSKNARWTLA